MSAYPIRVTVCSVSLMLFPATAYVPVAWAQSIGAEVTAGDATAASAQLAQQDNQAPIYSPPQLDQLLAPIALYPDPLLAQILMASTYPLEVVEAARWVQDPNNARLRGDQLDAALQPQNWDPSVKSLVPFPQVLADDGQQARLDPGARQRLPGAAGGRHELGAAAARRGPGRRYAAIDPAGNGLDPRPGDRRSSPPIPSSSTCPTMTRRWSMAAGPIPIIRRSISRRRRITATWRGRASISASASASSARCGVGTAGIGVITTSTSIPTGSTGSTTTPIAHDNRPRDTENTWQHDPAHRRGVPYSAPAVRQKFQPAAAGSPDARRDFRGFDNRGARRTTPVTAPTGGPASRRPVPPGQAGASQTPAGARSADRAPGGPATPDGGGQRTRGTPAAAPPTRAAPGIARAATPPPCSARCRDAAGRAAHPRRGAGPFSVRPRRPSRASAKAPRFSCSRSAARPAAKP